MAANDDFPRGTVSNVFVTGAITANVTVPAILNISHVLTDVELDIAVVAGASINGFLGVQFGANPALTLRRFFVASGPDLQVVTFSGKIAGAPGAAMQVFTSISGGGATTDQTLTVAWFDN